MKIACGMTALIRWNTSGRLSLQPPESQRKMRSVTFAHYRRMARVFIAESGSPPQLRTKNSASRRLK